MFNHGFLIYYLEVYGQNKSLNKASVNHTITIISRMKAAKQVEETMGLTPWNDCFFKINQNFAKAIMTIKRPKNMNDCDIKCIAKTNKKNRLQLKFDSSNML